MYKFPGQQKVVISRNWGFTEVRREEYVSMRDSGGREEAEDRGQYEGFSGCFFRCDRGGEPRYLRGVAKTQRFVSDNTSLNKSRIEYTRIIHIRAYERNHEQGD